MHGRDQGRELILLYILQLINEHHQYGVGAFGRQTDLLQQYREIGFQIAVIRQPCFGFQIDADLDESIDLLRDRLGVDPAHFAYPKAVAGSPAAEVAVRRRFRSAALARSRVNRVGADVHRLWRTPVQRSDDATTFARKADGGLRLEGEARSVTARVRYRGAVR